MPWEMTAAGDGTQEYLRQEFVFLSKTSVIPVNNWRLFVFYVPVSFLKEQGWDDKRLKEYIADAANRAGVAIYKPTRLVVDAETNGVKWASVAAFGENRWQGLTPQVLFERMHIVNAVASQVAGEDMEGWLDEMDIETNPVILSTAESQLPANSWYAALVMWPDAPMSEAELAEALESIGMYLYPSVTRQAGEYGRIVYMNTGNQARQVADITALLGASTISVNLAKGKESQFMDWAAKAVSQGYDIGEAAANVGAGLGEATEALLNVGAGLLTAAKYALYAAVPVAMAYGGWRGWKWWEKERKRR